MVKIEREDMLELTRRMTPSRNCFGRIAGDYRDKEGYDDGSFNTFFLNLKPAERDLNLSIAKAIPYSKTNEELIAYDFKGDTKKSLEIKRLLAAINGCELKNDALLDVLYEEIGKVYKAKGDYAIYVYHGVYDVPVKAKDKEWLEGSEEVYSFIICAICPVTGNYEAGKPECGFIYPAFMNRSSSSEHIAVFNAEDYPHPELARDFLSVCK